MENAGHRQSESGDDLPDSFRPVTYGPRTSDAVAPRNDLTAALRECTWACELLRHALPMHGKSWKNVSFCGGLKEHAQSNNR